MRRKQTGASLLVLVALSGLGRRIPPQRVGRRGCGERQCQGRRIDRHGRPSPSAGLYGAKFSNSMIEAWWRSLKQQRLFLQPLASVATIRRLVAFYVHEHNHVLPRSAFRGQTPDEMTSAPAMRCRRT